MNKTQNKSKTEYLTLRIVMVSSTFVWVAYFVWRALYGLDKTSKKLIDTPDLYNFVQSLKLLLFSYIGVFWLLGFCAAYFMFYPFKRKKKPQLENAGDGVPPPQI